jgi:hypothetical protein
MTDSDDLEKLEALDRARRRRREGLTRAATGYATALDQATTPRDVQAAIETTMGHIAHAAMEGLYTEPDGPLLDGDRETAELVSLIFTHEALDEFIRTRTSALRPLGSKWVDAPT